MVSCQDLTKIYGSGADRVCALDDVDLSVVKGEFTAIMGTSGSGKSTLIQLLAGLDSPTSGTISLNGNELTRMSERRLAKLRRQEIGFIFQSFNLIPTLTAKENITLPANIARKHIDEDYLADIVRAFRIEDRLSHKPSELSGGQQQRVACARALVMQPSVLFADEPTGNLDMQSSAEVLRSLGSAVHSFGTTVVMVTHDPDAAALADRVVFLIDGKIAGELLKPTREKILKMFAKLGNPISAENLPEMPKNPIVQKAATNTKKITSEDTADSEKAGDAHTNEPESEPEQTDKLAAEQPDDAPTDQPALQKSPTPPNQANDDKEVPKVSSADGEILDITENDVVLDLEPPVTTGSIPMTPEAETLTTRAREILDALPGSVLADGTMKE
jgi:ABC-type antimicrobial peptide transport system, ATPase component